MDRMVSSEVCQLVIDAMQSVDCGRGERGVRLLEKAFAIDPDLWHSLGEEYARAVESWALAAEDWEQAASRWVRCIQASKRNGYVYLSLGGGATRCGHEVEARAAFRAAEVLLRAAGDVMTASVAAECATRANARLVEAWHWRMVNDVGRNEAFCGAVAACCAGKRVADLGTGTGLLALAAAEAGASSVVACERSAAMVEIARRTIGKANVEILADEARAMDGEFDVCVAEVLDAGLFGEGALRTLREATRLTTKKNGVIIPSAATLSCAVVCSDSLRRSLRLGKDRALATKEPYDVASLDAIPHALISNVAQFELDLVDLAATVASSHTSMPIELGSRCVARIAPGDADAIVAWFDLDLLGDGRFVLSTAPSQHRPPHAWPANSWQQAVFGVNRKSDFAAISASIVSDVAEKGDLLRLRLDGEIPEICANLTPAEIERANDDGWRRAYAPRFEPVLELGFGAAGPINSQFDGRVTRLSSGIDVDDNGPDLRSLAIGTRFKTLLHSLIDPSGLLRAGALADLDLANKCLLDEPRNIAPAAARAFGIFVDSPDLAAHYYVQSDRALGFDLSALDDYATPHARDIEIYALDNTQPPIHAFLSDPFSIIDLDFEEYEEDEDSETGHARSRWSFQPAPGTIETRAAQPKTHQLFARRGGSAHALLVWWHLDFRHSQQPCALSTSPILDTLLPDGLAAKDTFASSHWRVAAYILNRGHGAPLERGDRITFTTAFRHSRLYVDNLTSHKLPQQQRNGVTHQSSSEDQHRELNSNLHEGHKSTTNV